MSMAVDGFYVGYFTGAAGNGLGMFVFKNGVIIGVDVLGVRFDGTYRLTETSTAYLISAIVTAPAGGQLVQGVSTGPTGLTYQVDATVPVDFENANFLTIPTQFGDVNVRLRKLRGLA